ERPSVDHWVIGPVHALIKDDGNRIEVVPARLDSHSFQHPLTPMDLQRPAIRKHLRDRLQGKGPLMVTCKMHLAVQSCKADREPLVFGLGHYGLLVSDTRD